MNYIERLINSSEEVGNVVCMGLDPVLSAIPNEGLPLSDRVEIFFSELFKAMKKRGLSPAAFKPNIGYYSILDRPREGDFSGSIALARVLDMLSTYFPTIPVILDSKRGDIAKSSQNYAEEAFTSWRADAVTVSPYMGSDSIMPFAFENKGMYILNRTSNPGSVDLQSRSLIDRIDERVVLPLYMSVAHKIAEWAFQHKGIGAVVGATSPDELEEIAEYYAGKNIPILIPGVGAQGGSAEDVKARLLKVGYDLRLARISSSSGLTHPWKKAPVPKDHIEQSLKAIEKLIKEASLVR